jgi:hypothetical protein
MAPGAFRPSCNRSFLISNLQIGNKFDKILIIMLGQDIPILLKLTLAGESHVLSKKLADEMFLSPSEISKSLYRSKQAGLLYWTDLEKRVNRSALLELIGHGLRYVFPAEKGGMTRGIPPASAAEPLNALLTPTREPPPVWPYPEGPVRGLSFCPLYKGAPQAALLDPELYRLLALCDAIRDGRARERALAIDLMEKALKRDLRPQSAST